MTRLFTRRTVTISIATAAILLGLFTVFWLVRESQYRNTSNISRGQYDTALAKWNNLHVTDYQATLQSTNWGRWKIVVHVDEAYGNKYAADVRATYSHRVVSFESLDNKSANLDSHLYNFTTVGGQFDELNDYLYCQENSCRERHLFWPVRFVVEFDQTMGYPSSITTITEFATVETRIENVIILP